MSLLVLIPLSIGMGLIGLVAFGWALRHDQFDDPKGNAERVHMPEAPPTADTATGMTKASASPECAVTPGADNGQRSGTCLDRP